MAHGRIVQISVSLGGVPKLRVAAARVTELGLEGDQHRDMEHHGGPERALCLFALEQIRVLQAEGHDVSPGAIGENLTVEGLDWECVTPGVRLELGAGVLIEVTRYTSPCFNIKKNFANGDFSRVSQKHHQGSSRVYARVLRTGSISQGDTVRLVNLAPA
ncbi:MAG: MOSC domain-containing protein [Candidatus Rokubacteria bacterium]|nr:MOSC domain-containing protein [Candidatus Rokubacteria bacterium]